MCQTCCLAGLCAVRPRGAWRLLDVHGRGLIRLIDDIGFGLAGNDGLIHDNLLRRFCGRKVIHGIEQNIFKYCAQPACPCFPVHGLFCHGQERIVAKFEFDAFHFEQLAVLLGQCIFRLEQDLHERVFVQLLERREVPQGLLDLVPAEGSDTVTLNLLDYRDGQVILMASELIPEGDYEKIRMEITAATLLTDNDDDPTTPDIDG